MRARLLVALFDATHRAYAQLRAHTRPAWGLDVDALRTFPTGSLGHELGEWLHARGYALMPHLETHDLMHVLTGIGTDVVSEVELQWLLAGNGKRSPYLIGAAALGAAVFPARGSGS